MEAPTVEGEILLELANRGSARFILGYGVVFALAGLAVAALGYPIALVALLPLPLFLFLSRRMSRKRVVFTTMGVLCAPGHHPALDAFVRWSEIEKAVFVTKRDTNSSGGGHFRWALKLERRNLDPVLYWFPSRPSDEELGAIARLSTDRGVTFVGP
jgi:hypothetical protein